jgi:hypothetical protein
MLLLVLTQLFLPPPLLHLHLPLFFRQTHLSHLHLVLPA